MRPLVPSSPTAAVVPLDRTFVPRAPDAHVHEEPGEPSRDDAATSEKPSRVAHRRMSADPLAQRHVTRRDARLEGEPDVEPGADDADAAAMKDAMRDLTSLSGPVPRGRKP